jgi:hypothetical protein
MVQPFNYIIPQADPFAGVLQGLKLGASAQQMEAAREQTQAQTALRVAQEREIQAKLAAQNRLATAADSLLGKIRGGMATESDFAEYRLIAPKDQSEAAAKVFEGMSKTQQQNALSFGTQVMAALGSTDPQIGIAMLEERAAAEREKNPQMAQAWETVAKLAKLDPANGIFAAGAAMAGLPGSKEAIEGWQKTQEERRASRMEPSVLKEAAAKADKAVADAITAQATATNAPERAAADAALARAQADKAKVDAKFAEQNVLADLKKKAADLGLTQAQTNSAIAQTRKLGVETATAALQLEALKATGGVDPQKKFDQEEKIRKEWQARSKVYGDLSGTFSNIQASAGAKTGPGDIALITGFMKMLDPGSVVRETEFATARDTAGLFDRLANQAQKLQSGQIFSLDSKQRQEYVTLAKQYLDAAQKKADQEKKDLGVVVKNYALNPENVFGISTPSDQGQPGAVPPRGAAQPSPGQRNVTVNF